MLNELCTADAEVLCEGVPNKDGKVQACLRGKRAQLSWDCQEELFRQEVGCRQIFCVRVFTPSCVGSDKC
jgi:hypothetical protein